MHKTANSIGQEQITLNYTSFSNFDRLLKKIEEKKSQTRNGVTSKEHGERIQRAK